MVVDGLMLVMIAVKSSPKVNVSVYSITPHLLPMFKNSLIKLSTFSEMPLPLMTKNSLPWHLFTAG